MSKYSIGHTKYFLVSDEDPARLRINHERVSSGHIVPIPFRPPRSHYQLLKDIIGDSDMEKLPVDILLLVFRELQESTVGSLQSFILPQTGQVKDSDRQQTTSRSWIPQVTCVCRHWRETALATPTLWQDVHLGPLTTLRHGSSPEIKRTVELAHPLPIRIQVHSKSKMWRPSRFLNPLTDLERLCELSQALEDHRDSISALHLLGFTYQEVGDLLLFVHTFPVIFPVLSDLQVTFLDYGEMYNILRHFTMPRLMRLSLSRFLQ